MLTCRSNKDLLTRAEPITAQGSLRPGWFLNHSMGRAVLNPLQTERDKGAAQEPIAQTSLRKGSFNF